MDAYEQNQAALFERLLKPHMERLYRFAHRLTRSTPGAEDLFQDVLTKAFGRLDELATLRDPGPWLRRVLYNQFVDNQRRYARRRLRSVSEGELDNKSIDSLPDTAAAADTAGAAGRMADLAALERALDALSDEHRTMVVMHDVEGYKLEEIQDITGVPVGTVKSRLHRARARLRALLENDGTFSAP